MLAKFQSYLTKESKSDNTVSSYFSHVENFLKWFSDSYGTKFVKLYRENVLDYKSYLLNIKKLNGKSVNAHLAALIKFNQYLVSKEIQEYIVAFKTDYVKIQIDYASPAKVIQTEVENFRQKLLETDNKRNYCLATLLAYTGMRISEALNIKLANVNLAGREILVIGKGEKQRVVIINDKCVNAIRAYLKERNLSKFNNSEFLFVSRQNEKVSRSRINRIFNNTSKKITPHTLRHFFCSYALEKGWSLHEVAAQVGHTNIQTTIIYTNPSREEIKRKANLL